MQEGTWCFGAGARFFEALLPKGGLTMKMHRKGLYTFL